MNGLKMGLLVVALALAITAPAAAQPGAEMATPTALPGQTGPEVAGSDPANGGGQSHRVETAAPMTAAPPASELVVVSRLDTVVASKPLSAEERQLESRRADFLKFAEVKLQEMNRNHILSRERMRIEKGPDGSYRASYHQIDDSAISFEVSRSPSKTAQYVAVLHYKERVYRAACGTPAECGQGDFSPVEVIPNRHIFVFSNGNWQ